MQPQEQAQNRIEVRNRMLIPHAYGVYRFYDIEEKLMYIGKANNLNSRVNSYFSDTHYDRPHIIPMIPKIAYISFIQTDNEVEALVLESALIHAGQPPYNVEKKDDKSYGYIYISTRDEIPTIEIVRSINTSDYKRGRLFGPYPNARATRRIFDYIRKMYPFCTCKKPDSNGRCLYVDIGLCPGPHHGLISREEYRKNIDGIIKFLTGSRKRFITDLERQMIEYSKSQQFESAAQLRDKIHDLKHLGTKVGVDYSTTESEFVNSKKAAIEKELTEIAKAAGIKHPQRIECYDISNIQGQFSYGSMVVAIDGKLAPNQYRIFKIKSLDDAPDDFESLKEVLSRRLSHVGEVVQDAKVDESLSTKPSLILIDGGKGQLSTVREVIPADIDIMGISKGRHLRRKGLRKKDHFWALRGPISLPIEIKTPRILVELRDEAHRYALRHHRQARGKSSIKSVLDDIKGIGPVKKKALKTKFGTVADMRNVELAQLLEVIKNQEVAERLFEALHQAD